MSGWEKAFHALIWTAIALGLLYVAARASGLFGLLGVIACGVWLKRRLQRMRP